MGVIRTIKKAIIKRLKLIYKHYRYKIIFLVFTGNTAKIIRFMRTRFFFLRCDLTNSPILWNICIM